MDQSRVVVALAGLLLAGCAPEGQQPPTTAVADSLLEQRVPLSVAGDTGWTYKLRIDADIDGDGAQERVVVMSDVTVSRAGPPIWEDGHRWQVYVEEADGSRTPVYARFLPNGQLTAQLVQAGSGRLRPILLVEHTPQRWAVYEITYRGRGRAAVTDQFTREIDFLRPFERVPPPARAPAPP